MFNITWKDQSSNYSREEEFSTIKEAIEAFRVNLTGLYRHSGGYVMLEDSERSGEDHLLEWHEDSASQWVGGQARIDYRPEEDIDECGEEKCKAHDEENEENEEFCEACEIKMREICLDRLLQYGQ